MMNTSLQQQLIRAGLAEDIVDEIELPGLDADISKTSRLILQDRVHEELSELRDKRKRLIHQYAGIKGDGVSPYNFVPIPRHKIMFEGFLRRWRDLDRKIQAAQARLCTLYTS
jgi:hypothetical protein